MSGDYGRERSSSIGGGPFANVGVIGDRRASRKSSVDAKDMTVGDVPISGGTKTMEGISSPAAKNTNEAVKSRTSSNGSVVLPDSGIGWPGTSSPQDTTSPEGTISPERTTSPQGTSGRPTSPTFHHGLHNRNTSVESVESQPEHRDFYPWARASPRNAIASSQQGGSHSRTASSGSVGRRHPSVSSIEQPKMKHVSHLSKQAMVEDDNEDIPDYQHGAALASHRTMINNHGESLKIHAGTINAQQDRLAQQVHINQQQVHTNARLWAQHEATETRIDEAQESNMRRFNNINTRFSHDALQDQAFGQNFHNINRHVRAQEDRNMDADHRQASLDFQLDDVRGQLITHSRELNLVDEDLEFLGAQNKRFNAQLKSYSSQSSMQISDLAHHVHQQMGQQTQAIKDAFSYQAAGHHHLQQQLNEAQAQIKEQNIVMQQVNANLARLGLSTTPITPTQAGMNFSNSAFTHQVYGGPNTSQQGFMQQGFPQQQAAPQHRVTPPAAGPSNAAPTQSRSEPRPVIPQPNAKDDVFAPMPTFQARRPGPPPIAEFEQKPYHELLHSIFVGVEVVVRSVRLKRLDPRSSDRAVQSFIKDMAEFNDDTQHTKKVVLRDPKCTIQMVMGYIGKCLVLETIDHTILDHFPNPALATEYGEACNDEARAMVDMMVANNAVARLQFAQNRARLARSIAQLPGFQQWVKDTAHRITTNLAGLLKPVVTDFQFDATYKLLTKPALEALKIGVRMRQDPKNFKCTWYGSGVRWDYRRMVQRNEELEGQDLTQDAAPYCVLFTMAPNIDEKVSDGKSITTTNLHKAEVILGPRKELLR